MMRIRATLILLTLLAATVVTTTPAGAVGGEPDTTVSSPTRNELVSSPVTFSGTTTDDVGVDGVRLAIRSRDTGSWLETDGSFGRFTYFDATVDAVGALTSGWTIDFDLPPGRYGASIRSQDVEGIVETSRPWIRFEVVSAVNTEPDSTITVPVARQEFEGNAAVTGSTVDDSAVEQVRLAIRNRDTNQWVQDGAGTFGTRFALVDAVLSDPGATQTDWSLNITLPAGNYFMSARGVDDTGLVETTRPGVRFTMVDPPDPGVQPLTFRAIADVPYSPAQVAQLTSQLPNLNADETFVAHLGDIKSSADRACGDSYYQTVRDALLSAPVPGYIVLGDNEWNDCDDLDAALARWNQYLGNFEDNYTDGPVVIRQTIRPENFAFIQNDVAFIGINNVGNQQDGQADWAKNHQDNAAWVSEVLSGPGAQTTTAVVFAHAAARKSLAEALAPYDRPVLYLMGDLHTYDEAVPHPLEAPKLLQVVLDNGMPGLSVTITHDPDNPWTLNRTP